MRALHKAFPISAETERELCSRGLLSFPNSRSFRYADPANGTIRGLNGKKFVRSDNKGADWHKLIGLADVIEHDRPFVVFVVEGSKDALAAFELAHRAGLLCQIGIVTALGAQYRPIHSEIEQLRGRRVLLIGDSDHAGIEAVRRVSHALTQHAVDHVVLNWNAFDFDGKDLFDFLSDKKAISRCRYNDFFSFFSPSNGSTVQQFSGSTNGVNPAPSGGFNSSTNIRKLVEQFVVKKRSTGNARSFALARALRGHEAATNTILMDTDIDEGFHHWFTKSRSLLPPDADEEKSLGHFYKQIRRVRYPTGSLDAAIRRAETLPLPDIPGLNATALKLAALMRELQRDSGDKSFICPVNEVVRFIPLRFSEQGKRLLLVLEKAGVAECVVRGAPHQPGKPGKSSLWRYRLSLTV